MEKHIEWLSRKSDVMKMFFMMIPVGNSFHLPECSWASETRGPDTCVCQHIMWRVYGVLNSSSGSSSSSGPQSLV
jgi:hypothetical protein